MTAIPAAVGLAEPHHEDVDTIGRRWRTGVLLLILADVAFVVSLIFSYFYLRGLNTEGSWVPAGAKTATIWVGWAIAAVLVLSAVAYRWGLAGIRAGKTRQLVIGMALASVVMLVAAVFQVVQLASFGFKPDANAYASSVYTIAGANLFHLLLTLFLGAGLWNRSRLGRYTATSFWQVEILASWFAWVAVAALGGALATSFIASPNHLSG
ncbi:MAG: cytochrome c oxidase subunit 3 [Jatrophihabitantaceae bacterium]